MKRISLKKTLKCISFICLVVIACEIIFLIYQKYKIESNTIYYDITNDVVLMNDGYLEFGSSDFKYSKKHDYTNGYEHAKIVKYNNNKEIIYEIKYDNAKVSTFYSGISVSDGIIAIGSAAFNDEQIESDLKDALIVKYDNEGNLLWEETYQVLGDTKFLKVIELNDEYYVIGQSILPPMELGFNNNGGGIITRYSKDGNLIGNSSFGGGKSGVFSDIAVVNDQIYVVGKDATRTGLMVKYNLNLERQWIKNYNYTDEIGFSAIATDNNYLYVAGSTKVVEDLNDYDTDALLLAYDLDGNIKWAITYKGNGMERFNDIILNENHLVLAGHSSVYDEEESTEALNVFRYHGIFAIYDTSGNEVKVNEFGGSRDDYITGLVKENDNYLVFGYSNSKDKDFKNVKANGKDYFSRMIEFNLEGKLKKVW